MAARRVVVWVVSAGFGAICVLAALRLFDTNLDKFAPGNALLVFLSMGALAFIWLDFIFRTNYLRS
jgi:hypothetical protein